MKKTIASIFIAIGAIVIIIGVIFYFINKNDEKNNNLKKTQTESSSDQQKEILEQMSENYVSSESPWITPVIDYKYKIRTDGHAYNLEFTSKNGGWTEKVLVPAEGNFNNMPDDAISGPVKITAGPGETRFLVQLYKRITK